MTPEQIEARDREWLANVYAGDRERQLTPRSVVVGMVLGSVMSLSNLYSGLKIGWSFGASSVCRRGVSCVQSFDQLVARQPPLRHEWSPIARRRQSTVDGRHQLQHDQAADRG